MGMVTRQYDIFIINLDPTIGHEIKKTRPCVIISPDEMNKSIGTVIIAPMTTKSKAYPTRVGIEFQSKPRYRQASGILKNRAAAGGPAAAQRYFYIRTDRGVSYLIPCSIKSFSPPMFSGVTTPAAVLMCRPGIL